MLIKHVSDLTNIVRFTQDSPFETATSGLKEKLAVCSKQLSVKNKKI